MYEVGMTHTAEKRAAVAIRHIEDIYFDLINHRSISCDYTPRGISELEKGQGDDDLIKIKRSKIE